MPVFDYECPKCGREEQDVFQFRNNGDRKCGGCGAMMEKKPAVFNPVFNGSGFTPKFYSK
jgi:putative FmdB family regulatory protein